MDLLLGLFFYFFILPIFAVEVVLYDSTNLQSLSWISNQQSGSRQGWKEASYVDSEGSVRRIYTVCNVDVAETQNWIRTRTFTKQAFSRIYFRVSFTMRKCIPFPDPTSLQQCKEIFKLFYRESNREFSEDNSFSEFQLVDTIAATTLFLNRTFTPVNTETRSITIQNNNFQLALLDQGSCTTLLSIQIYYLSCPSLPTTSYLASFVSTPTGPLPTSMVKVDGTCISNAQPSISTPSMLCTADGTWYPYGGTCLCQPGFTISASFDACEACEMGTYKANLDNSPCISCPSNTLTLLPASTACICAPAYEKGSDKDATKPCRAMIGSLREVKVEAVNSSACTLSWLEPINYYNITQSLLYAVKCSDCDELSTIIYVPAKTALNSTKVTINGLNSQITYNISIIVYYSEQIDLSTGTITSLSCTTTMSNLSTSEGIWGLQIKRFNNDVFISWIINSTKFNLFELVVGQHFDKSPETSNSYFSQINNFTINRLTPFVKYSFKIRGKYNDLWSSFSETYYINMDSPVLIQNTTLPSEKIGLIIGIILGLIVAIICISTVSYLLFLRRKKKSENSCANSSSDCDILKYVIANPTCSDTKENTSTRSSDGSHIYADPNSFEGLIAQSTINLHQINFDASLHRTWCSEIWRGYLTKHSNSIPKPVLLEKISDKIICNEEIILHLQHKNVIKVRGFVENPCIIVLESVSNGFLSIFLQKNGVKLLSDQLYSMLKDIAAGMDYLARLALIHRNLSTDAIMLDENMNCKIGCLNLLIDSEKNELVNTSLNIALSNIRWTCPHAISKNSWSLFSDIWSMGVLIWHVVMRATELPYDGWTDEEIVKAVTAGLCLSKPENCSSDLYRLMLECWRLDCTSRPTFANIIQTLNNFLNDGRHYSICSDIQKFNSITQPVKSNSSFLV